MKPLTILSAASLSLFLSFTLSAQTVTPPDRVTLQVDYLSDEVGYDPFDAMSTLSGDSIRITVVVILPSGQAVSKFHVKAGTTSGGSDIADLDFNYDGTSIPAGAVYRREGNIAYLCIGDFSGNSTVFAEVQLEDNSSNLSTASTVSF